MTRSHKKGWNVALAPLALFLAACPEKPPAPDAPPGVATRPPVEPLALSPAPQLPHAQPGELLDRSAFDFKSVGVTDTAVVAPLMRFPIQKGPAFANSQIFLPGGFGYKWTDAIVYPGPGGTENVASNFDYPWRDDFCEVRRAKNEICNGDVGHEGQDIRPSTCTIGAHVAVAAERSKVRRIGQTHLVLLYGLDSGHVYTYLHLARPLAQGVVKGAILERGAAVGFISNIQSATATTTTHLHFEISAGAAAEGSNKGVEFLPPYTSLVESYLDLVAENPDQFSPVPQPANCKPL